MDERRRIRTALAFGDPHRDTNEHPPQIVSIEGLRYSSEGLLSADVSQPDPNWNLYHLVPGTDARWFRLVNDPKFLQSR